MLQRFSFGLAGIASLLSLLGSLLAPAAIRIQPIPSLFPGPAAPGLGLPFADPRWPLAGALLAGLIVGLLLRRIERLPAALGYTSVLIVWGMLWGGGLTERGLIAAGLIGLLATVCLRGALLQSNHRRLPDVVLVLVPHALCLLFLLGQAGLTSPVGAMISIGLVHSVLALRGALNRPLLTVLFLLQSALLVVGTTLFPLLPGR